jgi:hypothetical protein
MTRPGPLNLDPKTHAKRAADLRTGDVVLESHQHPARIVRLSYAASRVNVWCRYIWQATHEPDWKLGSFPHDARLQVARKGEY